MTEESRPADKVIAVGSSVIQHGSYNGRVYLLHLDPSAVEEVLARVTELAQKHRYSKIIAKVPERVSPRFQVAGFRREARIPDFFQDKQDLYFMSKYYSKQRQTLPNSSQLQKIRDVSKKAAKTLPGELPPRYEYRKAAMIDCEEIADTYQRVFDTYPFPIFDPDYVRDNLSSDVVYFTIRYSGELVAVSAAETAPGHHAVEMTDFATLPEHRGQGLASYLLWEMEKEMQLRGIFVAYTICRADSYGINITFRKRGYHFGGMLPNNTNISGHVSSMNVWYKHLLSQLY